MPKNKNLSGGLFSKKPLTVKETALSGVIAEYLTARRIYNDRLNSGKIFTGTHVVHLCKKGTPDRFAIVEGVIVFIEVKQLGKEATPEQITRHAELRASGAVVIVVDSFDDFQSKFNHAVHFVRQRFSTVS